MSSFLQAYSCGDGRTVYATSAEEAAARCLLPDVPVAPRPRAPEPRPDTEGPGTRPPVLEPRFDWPDPTFDPKTEVDPDGKAKEKSKTSKEAKEECFGCKLKLWLSEHRGWLLLLLLAVLAWLVKRRAS